jgi:hypothetical protein
MMSHSQNPVGFENDFGKSGKNPLFPSKFKVALYPSILTTPKKTSGWAVV